jgi:signal peptidase II
LWGLVIAVTLVLLLDQVSKRLVAARLNVGQSWDIAPWLSPVIRITYVKNTGVVFGLFPGMGEFFILVAAVVVVIILIYYWRLPEGQGLMQVALAFQLGGALGNLVDRLRLGGAVVDFLDLNFWPLHNWPIFNFADASIVTGVGLLALLMLWEEWRERQDVRQMAEGN